jgi:hypothetical protein
MCSRSREGSAYAGTHTHTQHMTHANTRTHTHTHTHTSCSTRKPCSKHEQADIDRATAIIRHLKHNTHVLMHTHAGTRVRRDPGAAEPNALPDGRFAQADFCDANRLRVCAAGSHAGHGSIAPRTYGYVFALYACLVACVCVSRARSWRIEPWGKQKTFY